MDTYQPVTQYPFQPLWERQLAIADEAVENDNAIIIGKLDFEYVSLHLLLSGVVSVDERNNDDGAGTSVDLNWLAWRYAMREEQIPFSHPF